MNINVKAPTTGRELDDRCSRKTDHSLAEEAIEAAYGRRANVVNSD
jgi:hypothetical protein